MEEGELMSKEEMALLLNRIVSCSVEKAGKNYGDARKALHELGFSDEQMILFGFPKLIMAILQEEGK